MMVSVCEYIFRTVDEHVVLTAKGDLLSEADIAKVHVGPWLDIEDHRAWHVEEIGVQVAQQLLLYHLSRGRGVEEANLVARYWRRKFARHVLSACIEVEVHLPDVFLNSWLVERLLDEVKESWGSSMRKRLDPKPGS